MSDLTALPEREQIVADATRSFLAVLPAELAETVRAAAIPHWFDAPLLAALLALPPEEAGRRYAALQEMPFVQAVGGRGHALHELTRRLLLDELWAERPADFRAWSRRAAESFDGQADADDTARIEAIYHWLAADPDRGADLVWTWDAEWNNTFRYNLVYALVQAGLEHDAAGRLAGRAKGWVYYSKGSLHSLYSENREALASLQTALEAAGSDRQLEANCIKSLGDVHSAWPSTRPPASATKKPGPSTRPSATASAKPTASAASATCTCTWPSTRSPASATKKPGPSTTPSATACGEANCIKSLGDVHLRLAEYPPARQRYEEA